ncbi:DNA-packaging protein [Pseudomonas lactis]|uniref:DNA-packaging protein n=1 Tax=Pseudomonas lactis TaxID=1615674 RepID=UPI0012957CDA|nr:DNA-packaging protein [Pseudomonas lactis]MQB17530.1 DNA-packaging protein [Pseudomonas lactis]
MKSLFDLVKPLLWYVAVIGAVVYCIHLNREDGKDEGYRLGKSEAEITVAVLRQEYAVEKQLAADAALELLRAEQGKSNQLASQLADSKETLRQTTDRLTGDIARVTKLYRRALNAQPEPLPAAVFTVGFVRVWNTANGIAPNPAMPTPNGSGRTPALASGTGTADDLDSGVTQEQLLTNQVRNGELYGVCRAQLKNLINWTRNESK